jgi:hypothetical protein
MPHGAFADAIEVVRPERGMSAFHPSQAFWLSNPENAT